MCNENKKDYLNRYRKIKNKIVALDLEIKLLREAAMLPSSNQSNGLPGGTGNKTDLSDYVAKLEALQEKKAKEIERAIISLQEIIDYIHMLDDSRYIWVLTNRFVYGKTWEQMWVEYEEEFGEKTSVRQLQRINGYALRDLEVVNEEI